MKIVSSILFYNFITYIFDEKYFNKKNDSIYKYININHK